MGVCESENGNKQESGRNFSFNWSKGRIEKKMCGK